MRGRKNGLSRGMAAALIPVFCRRQKEKGGQHARAGVRADDRADVADVRADAVRVEQRGKLAGVFQTVAVADAHNLVPVGHLAQRPFREVGNRFLPAADLAADVEFTRIVNPDDRLDAKQPPTTAEVLLSRPAAVQGRSLTVIRWITCSRICSTAAAVTSMVHPLSRISRALSTRYSPPVAERSRCR